MNCFSRLSILILLLSAVFVGTVFNTSSAQSQNAQAIITWQANNYFPANYQGRALATNKTTINASVELISNQKIQDLSGATITWYLDGGFFKKGVGLKETSFVVTKTRGGSHTIRVSIKAGEIEAGASALINVFDPEIVIENPSPDNLITAGSSLALQAIPYFFNVLSISDLSFLWKANNSTIAEQAQSITLNIGFPQTESQRNLLIEVFAKNLKNSFESSKQQLKLIVL